MRILPQTILLLVLPMWLFMVPQASKAMVLMRPAIEATFVIRSDDLEERLLGSGFRFLRPGLAVTNAHVVGSAGTVLIVDVHGNREVATVVARDTVRDIAILRVSPSDTYILPPEGEATELGQVVYAIGAPYGVDFSLSRGIVSAMERQIEANVPVRMIQHDAAVNPGSSGGPLLDFSGHLIGMNSQIADGFRNFIGIAYAIPTETLVAAVARLEGGGDIDLPRLGLRTRPIDPKIAAALGLETREGILVDSVEAGSLAASAGVQPGDILRAVNGQPIMRVGDLAFALEAVVGQGGFDLLVIRGGAHVELRVRTATDTPTTPVRSGEPAKRTEYRFDETGMQIGADGVIEDVTELSLAHYEGLQAGDRILAVNGAGVTNTTFEQVRITRPVLLLVRVSDGSTKHIVLDPWARPGRMRPVSGANVLDEAVVLF
ncbi:trypsin-like peptidase domain-containing protein [Shimia abyssi]|uniref:S1-C subfamily serine protease n=1 Tax=Shimia abyssi TaxID=1662395 RepID=A0A2P8FBS3_9RHOB|nr:trypsin-like peptidase domain-containing protein [Shimia abyssi]PSL19191.1 S1-C subfamily serine protease [Shimia abyssi]